MKGNIEDKIPDHEPIVDLELTGFNNANKIETYITMKADTEILNEKKQKLYFEAPGF